VRRKRLADLLGDHERTGGIGLGKHERELLAAVARHDIDLAHHLAEHARELRQGMVAGDVTVAVVEVLEVVGVHHEQRHVLGVALRASYFLVETKLQVAIVEHAGELIGDREVLRQLVELRVLDRDHQFAGHGVDHEAVVVSERLDLGCLGAHEHHHRAVVEHAQAREVRLDLVDVEAAPVRRGDTALHPNARREDRLGLLLVDDEHRHRRDADDTGQDGDDLEAHLVEVQGGVDDLGDL